MGTSQYTQQSSPYDSMELMRRPGSMAMARPRMPFNNSPASTLGRSVSGDGYLYGRGLLDRPTITSLIRLRCSPDPPPLHSLVHSHPPVSYNLCLPPRTLIFREVPRQILTSDLTRFVCEALRHTRVPSTRVYHGTSTSTPQIPPASPSGISSQPSGIASGVRSKTPIS